MNREEILKLLNDKNVEYELENHEAVNNMEELKNIELLYPELDAKNLFLRDDKKRNYYLVTIKGDKKVDLKEFKNKYNTRSLSFASDDDLLNILGLTPGSVTPFGLLNDKDSRVIFYIDEFFKDKKIGVHPNDNRATVWIKSNDLVNIIKESGNSCFYIEM
jgi:Ala-tRNA(Pro) deacylase